MSYSEFPGWRSVKGPRASARAGLAQTRRVAGMLKFFGNCESEPRRQPSRYRRQADTLTEDRDPDRLGLDEIFRTFEDDSDDADNDRASGVAAPSPHKPNQDNGAIQLPESNSTGD